MAKKPAALLFGDTPSTAASRILRGFNDKVTRLENTRFHQRYLEEPPSIIMRFDREDRTDVGPMRYDGGPDGDAPSINLSISGYVTAWIDDFDQDAVEAFVLTYRLLSQDNDRYSVRNLARLYDCAWIGADGRERLADARAHIAAVLDEYIVSDFGEGPLQKGDFMDVVIYGGLAHSNEGKERRFQAWTSNSTSAAMVWIEFMAVLRGLMRYLLYIRDLNSIALFNGFGDPLPVHLQHLVQSSGEAPRAD